MKRLFFALDISQQDKEIIEKWRRSLSISARPVPIDNFHITLVFLGNTTQKIEETLLENTTVSANFCSPQGFQITLESLGLFRKPQVLYLTCSHFPDKLKDLAAQLKCSASQLNIPQEKRPFLPHLTLYRKAKSLPDQQTICHQVTIKTFSLYHSISTPQGVMYRPIKSWPLVQR